MMKELIKYICAAVLLAASLTGCHENYITYHDNEYVMFADTAKMYVVREDIPSIEVPIASTVACDYDRNFAVEVVTSSSSAVLGRDFTLESNNFTIPAGERVGYVKVTGNMDNLKSRQEVDITLRLVMPDRLVMPLYGDETIVHLRRLHKFHREDFTGWAVVSSMFLYEYSMTRRYQRLIKTSADPEDENGVILHGFMADGYDVRIAFDDETDPVNPSITMPSDQVASDEASIFGMVHGDNHILIEGSNQGPSYFFSYEKIAVLVNRFYVQKIGNDVGTVGHFLTEIDWVSDEEAERLKREDGM
ncbi:MAG: DUF4984 domain-containing protein [Bacteroidales bacterium]|nr:DUF4984 domain-containing protein [Bacteroidales bacterium]